MILACGGLGWTTAAHGQGHGELDLAWVAPEGCPSAGEVQSEIDNLLGDAAGARAHEPLVVRATVERGDGWLVRLETRSAAATGRRTIEAASCQALASATALIVALMIDPDAVAARAAPSAPPGPQPAPPAPAPAPSPPPAERGMGTFVGLGAIGHLGVLPGPDVSPFAAFGLAPGHWRAELRLAYAVRSVRSEGASDAGGAYGSFRFFAGTLTTCWMALGEIVDLGPCAQAELGLVNAEGIGEIQAASATTPWLGVGGGGVVVLKPSPRLHVAVHADAVAPLWRPRYLFREDIPVFRAWPVGARLTAGVEVLF